ncbi:preprotein translocase subunit SecA [Jannaschia seosinensis]|uniref:Preprotein translocase subunit SecA n=1 Tax=Jannaschia seosinensis TaxID=313367 RepID=A0A0M7BCW3_9RHOB|nr:SEC-C domain-containing protein [Jannaschia seosinensis]CUH39175.1 preprotein translocase subunit SecA [Jannaschia seosinensis]
MNQSDLEAALGETAEQMEALSLRLRDMILSQPPLDLLGWIAARPLMAVVDDGSSESRKASSIHEENQFLLEYVHAALASAAPSETGPLQQEICEEVAQVAEELRAQAMQYGMIRARSMQDTSFGDATADVAVRAFSNWVVNRGNRYQQLEGEFYGYVLAPHDDLLNEVYGMGASAVADAVQRFADSQRTGQMEAAERLMTLHTTFRKLADNKGTIDPKRAEAWKSEHRDAFAEVFVDLFRAGSQNATRRSGLPEALLADLSYARGEDVDFFAEGPLKGTPFRTLPVRKKPLIEIEGDQYALDACQMRDAGYRAILHHVQERLPEAKKSIREAQGAMCEKAFADIFSDHLRGARVHEAVYYRDPTTRQWVENDVLILLDDVLIQIEAKSGAAATIASPESDFARHAQALTRLVGDAYRQCARFIAYLHSEEEVAIFARRDGRYVEVDRIRRADYRLMVPLGMTVETFSPFSAMSKILPEVVPIEGRHTFLSLSIDELFVLRRFLPTAGALVHYLLVRQAAAMKPELHLFDGFDNLGAYLTRNRYDTAYYDERVPPDVSMLIIDGASEVIDAFFNQVGEGTELPPSQPMPTVLTDILARLDLTRPDGWLRLDACIRDYDAVTRERLGGELESSIEKLRFQSDCSMILSGDQPLFLWIQRYDAAHDDADICRRAAAAKIATRSDAVVAARVKIGASGELLDAVPVQVQVPPEGTRDRLLVEEYAADIVRHLRAAEQTSSPRRRARKLGRNASCWCGSGRKFKKCHGR